ncbi:MAG: hypothetical protein RIB45_18015 [Marivibrio sp.]|uniref:hypothetical protein n=1 Tax=Marivibrio sp. TaxID=2039719 RepID=UPI0032EAAF5E
MSQSRFAAGSIEELLAAVADGVREAQDALNDLPMADAFGRPQARYHVPYVDFDITVDLTASKTEGEGAGGAGATSVVRPKVSFTPVTKLALAQRLSVTSLKGGAGGSSPKAGSSASSSSISSKVSGRIVSVPPGDGKPTPRLAFLELSDGASARRRPLRLEAANSAGEVLADRRVEFNIDWAASAELSPADAKPKRAAGTQVSLAETLTDASGAAAIDLALGASEPRGAVFVVVATCAGVDASVVVTR